MDSLKELERDIAACAKCPLRESATKPVPGVGSIGAKYMVIGEAPGREEDQVGVPFVGASGKRLDKLLSLAKIKLNDCYFSNVCRCRPPGNDKPKKFQVKCCSPFLMRELRLVHPEYVIVLGATPLGVFSPYGITQTHGTMFEFELEDCER